MTENTILIRVTYLEADLIQKIRSMVHGEVNIKKVNGEPVQVDMTIKQRLEKQDGLIYATKTTPEAKIDNST